MISGLEDWAILLVVMAEGMRAARGYGYDIW